MFFLQENYFFPDFMSKHVKNKLRYDPGTPLERSGAKFWLFFASEPHPDLLWRPIWVAKRCDLGSLGVPGRASTPLAPPPAPPAAGLGWAADSRKVWTCWFSIHP